MIKDKVEKQTGKVITLKELSNIMAQSKSESSKNNLESAVMQLCEKHGKSVMCYIYVCVKYDEATHQWFSSTIYSMNSLLSDHST